MKPEPIRRVAGHENPSLHKCRCRQIVVVRPGVLTICRCGRRYTLGETQAVKTVVIGEQR